MLFLSCSSVRACVRDIVNMISCRVFDTFSLNLHQPCVMRYGTGMNASQFGVKRSKVKVTVE